MGRVNDSELRNLQTGSQMSNDDLLRNLLHRVGSEDGVEDTNALQYLHSIANGTLMSGLAPNITKVLQGSDTNMNLLVECPANMRIVVYDLFVSINSASSISFVDKFDTSLLSTLYGPNAGQGFTMSSLKGKFLPRSTSLYVQSSLAVNWSVDISYSVFEDCI